MIIKILDKLKKTNYKEIVNILTIFYFLLIFFFWGIDSKYLEVKILTPVIFLTYIFLKNDLKDISKTKIYLFLVILSIHQILIFFIYKNFFSYVNIIYFIYICITILTAIFTFYLLKKNFFEILITFLFLFNIFFIIALINYSLLFSISIDCFGGIISEMQFIFKESSHFALVSAPTILSGLQFYFKKEEKKLSRIFFRVNYIIFILFSFFNISNIFLILIICFGTLLLIKEKNYKKKTFLCILVILSIFFLINKSQCKNRLVLQIKKDLFETSIFEPIFGQAEKVKKNDSRTINYSNENLSYEVFITSLKIAGLSIQENPFGVGINNYEFFFNEKIFNIKNISEQVKFLNRKDASNNFAKIIVEFGILGIILYFWISKLIVKIDVNNPLEIFLIICISAQSIRGVGYFIGSFMFMVSALYILKINENKKNIS